MDFDRSDVTKLVNDLEGRGSVARLIDSADLRRYRVSLTAKGKRQLEISDRELAESMRSFLSALSATEYRQLHQLLLKAIRSRDPRFDAAGSDDARER